MADKVEVYRDDAKEWRWRRTSENGNIVADSGEGYKNKEDCVNIAFKVNAYPYILEVKIVDVSLETFEEEGDK